MHVHAPAESSFVTVDQLAERFKINRFTIYHWLKSEPERLPKVSRLFGRILFSEAAIAAFVANPPAPRPERRGRPRRDDTAPIQAKRRGRPTKADQVARRLASCAEGQQ